MTGEPALITAIASGRKHMAEAIRHRQSDGAATEHTHSGATMCGRSVESILPWVPVDLHNGCEECIDMHFDLKLRRIGEVETARGTGRVSGSS